MTKKNLKPQGECDSTSLRDLIQRLLLCVRKSFRFGNLGLEKISWIASLRVRHFSACFTFGRGGNNGSDSGHLKNLG